MRSEPRIGLLAFWLCWGGIVGCDGQDTHTRQICESVSGCTGLDLRKCASNLERAVEDYRLSRASVVRCSRCLERNQSVCGRILDERRCDRACEEVELVLNARTSVDTRAQAVLEIHTRCGDVLGTSDDTYCALQAEQEADSELIADEQVATCLRCIQGLRAERLRSFGTDSEREEVSERCNDIDAPKCISPPGDLCTRAASSGAEPAARTKTLAEPCAAEHAVARQGRSPEDEALLCSEVVTECGAACRGVPAVRDRLVRAAVCVRDLNGCYVVTDPEAPAGVEERGEGEEMPLADFVPVPRPLEDRLACYERNCAGSEEKVRSCADCLASQSLCSEIAAVCDTCQGL